MPRAERAALAAKGSQDMPVYGHELTARPGSAAPPINITKVNNINNVTHNVNVTVNNGHERDDFDSATPCLASPCCYWALVAGCGSSSSCALLCQNCTCGCCLCRSEGCVCCHSKSWSTCKGCTCIKFGGECCCSACACAVPCHKDIPCRCTTCYWTICPCGCCKTVNHAKVVSGVGIGAPPNAEMQR